LDKFFDLRSALLRHFEIFERPVFKNEDLFLFQKIEVGNCAAARIDNGIATHARVARARPTGTCRRQSDAPCVHGSLGFELSEATVAKYMVRHRNPPSQTWRT